MRVIAGAARGTALVAPSKGTRPVSDRAREGMFSSLGDRVVDATCLDLFAGTGALGIEALSRGATTCTFVDRSKAATAVVRENLRRAHVEDRATVITRDVESFLQGSTPGEPPGLVFVDPPYDVQGEALEGVLARVGAAWLPAAAWTVVVTRGHKGSLPAVPLHWTARRQLRYGDSLVILYGPSIPLEVGWA
jgi:16S rRNA (guanine966-N2)-methyltransferase